MDISAKHKSRYPSVAVLLLVLPSLALSLPTASGGEVRLRAERIMRGGVSRPIFGAAPDGQSGLLYISERQQMEISIVDLNNLGDPNVIGSTPTTSFLDLTDVVGGQLGMQSFAFHPDYAENGKFYVNVSRPVDGLNTIQVLEFQRSAEDPYHADPSSERVVLSIPNQFATHNGGWLGFSPTNGYLYMATGDGGNFGLPTDGLPAQDTFDIRGKMLRIDVNGDDFPDDSTRNYSIPETNPFADAAEGAPEVFAYGFRHPYRASFDAANGDLYVADVGLQRFEEVDLIPAGAPGGMNFGWRAREGFEDTPAWDDPAPPDAVDPIFAYSESGGAAIIGGYVYRGEKYPAFQGQYIYNDFVHDKFGTLKIEDGEVVEFTDRTEELTRPDNPVDNYAGISSFGYDADGELYFFDEGNSHVYRLVAEAIGDYNGDGVVDGGDYDIWKSSFGSTTDLAADGNENGIVDAADYTLWRDNLAATGAAPLVSQVPEPGAIILALSAVAMLSTSCRRRKC